MIVDRRRFLHTASVSLAACPLVGSAPVEPQGSDTALASRTAGPDWTWVRDQFAASRDWAHFSSFLIASHPRPVREAIDALRRAIDLNPAEVIEGGMFTRPDEVRRAVALYLGGRAEDVALTGNTTEGLAFVYSGLRLAAGTEVLTTTHDHYAHHESIRLATTRAGATMRKVALYDDSARASEDEILTRFAAALRPATRAVGVTWVHSSTGVKLPLRGLARVVADANRSRDAADRILVIVDGVHGIGVEDETVADIGCDFFCAGTHKWIFGPRGTGIAWGRKDAWERVQPTVPSFEAGPYFAWQEEQVPGPTRAAWMSPGGFHAFEHVWSLPAAFDFHRGIGRGRIGRRIHELNSRIKDGLAEQRHVTLHTPRREELSSGLVSFEVAGLTPQDVVKRLHDRRIIASTSSYKRTFVRLAGSLLNSPAEVDEAVRAVAALG